MTRGLEVEDVVPRILSSSSYHSQHIEAQRKRLFFDWSAAEKTREDTQTHLARHLAYHCSHLPEAGASSVCMHREGFGQMAGRTVSFSHLSVRAQHSDPLSGGILEWRYFDGPPCQGFAPDDEQGHKGQRRCPQQWHCQYLELE